MPPFLDRYSIVVSRATLFAKTISSPLSLMRSTPLSPNAILPLSPSSCSMSLSLYATTSALVSCTCLSPVEVESLLNQALF